MYALPGSTLRFNLKVVCFGPHGVQVIERLRLGQAVRLPSLSLTPNGGLRGRRFDFSVGSVPGYPYSIHLRRIPRRNCHHVYGRLSPPFALGALHETRHSLSQQQAVFDASVDFSL